jgi:hypothetical protein
MTLEFSQLYQLRENSTNAVELFGLGISMKQAQVFLKVANVADQSALVRIFHDSNGSTWNESTALFWDLKILPGQVLEANNIFLKDNTGTIAYRSSVANALTATVYEIIEYL